MTYSLLYSTAPSARDRALFQYSRLLKIPFKLSLNICPRNGASTSSLGNLFHQVVQRSCRSHQPNREEFLPNTGLILPSLSLQLAIWRLDPCEASAAELQTSYVHKIFSAEHQDHGQIMDISLCKGGIETLSVSKISVGQGPPTSPSSCFLLTPAHLITFLYLLITQVWKKGQHLLQIWFALTHSITTAFSSILLASVIISPMASCTVGLSLSGLTKV